MSTSWHHEHAVGRDGERFRYIALDVIPAPFGIDGRLIRRVVGNLPRPVSGRCDACGDPMTTTIDALVEHTTWGRPYVSTVCSRCAADPGWRERECRERALGRG